MSWKDVDLNLIVIFDALMSERNVTRAGKKIGLSQPAMSAALAKMRLAFKDELFIRDSGGIKPTLRALELSGKFKPILAEIRDAISEQTFDPTVKSYALKVEMDSYSQLCFLPQLYRYLREHAPGVQLRLKTSEMHEYPTSLENFETDLIFTTAHPDSNKFRVTDVSTDDYVVISAKKFKHQRLTNEELCSLPHIDICGLTPHRGEIDRFLEAKKLFRTIQFRINFPGTAFALLKHSDLLTIIPRQAEKWIEPFDLKVYELPFTLKPITLKMVCMPSFNDCAFYDWISVNFPKIVKS